MRNSDSGRSRSRYTGPARCTALLLAFLLTSVAAAQRISSRVPLPDLLSASRPPLLVGYSPSGVDPRNPHEARQVTTSSLRDDLTLLRQTFDGLILYGYDSHNTPRTLAIAAELRYRVVILGIWDPRSTDEIDGVSRLVQQFSPRLTLAVCIGNEGLTFARYEEADLQYAADRLRFWLGANIPLTTSEPLTGYKRTFVRQFGDFLLPNIHPVWDRRELGPVEAAAWTREQARELAHSTGKLVIVKETGFPHARSHEGSPEFTPELQQQFWEAYLKDDLLVSTAEGRVYHGVLFEAFDLPWKAEASGIPTEAAWGLYSPDRKPYPVVEFLNQWRAGRSPE